MLHTNNPYLQIVKSPPSAVEAESKAKLMLLQLQAHALKQYPNLDGKQRDAGGKVSCRLAGWLAG